MARRSSTQAGSPIDFERELNPAPLEAVAALDGAHLVIAGAGTGKTRTLVYRVAYHSFANLVLCRHAQRLGYADRFTIIRRPLPGGLG